MNSAHASFSRRRDNRGPNSQDIDPTALGVNINPYTPSNFLQMGITGYFSVGCGTCGPGFFNTNTFQFADDIDLIRGKHQIAFGIDMVRTQNNLSSYHNADGNFTFSGTGVNSTGDAMADFELGIMGASGFTFSKAQLQALRETIPRALCAGHVPLESADHDQRGSSLGADVISEGHLWAREHLQYAGISRRPDEYSLFQCSSRLVLLWRPWGKQVFHE